jgi:predicted MFS family arabinose efflux permease
MIAINVPGNGMLGQLQPLLTDRGLGMQQAAMMLTVYAVSVLVGRLVLGYLLDRISPALVAAVSVTLPALGAAALIGDSTTVLTASIAVALLGLSQGVEMDLTAFFIARFFGMRHYSMLFAAIISGLVLANASGALMFGRIYDATGSYDMALTIGTGLFVIGGACILALRWCKPAQAFAHDDA